MKFKLKLKIYNPNEVAKWQQEHVDEFDAYYEKQLEYLQDMGANDSIADSIAVLEADIWKTRKKMIDQFNRIDQRHISRMRSIRYSIYLFLVCFVFFAVFVRLI